MTKKYETLIMAVALVFMIGVMTGQWREIRAMDLHLTSSLLSLSVAGVVLILFLDAFGWHLILRSLGCRLAASRSIRIWMISSLSRYIPGGVWSYSTRIGMAQAEGVDIASTSISLYLETLLVMASSLAVGFPALFSAAGMPVTPTMAAVVWLILGILMHPRLIALARFLPGRAGDAFAITTLPSIRFTVGLYAYYVLFWIALGGVFICFVAAFYPLPHQHWVTVGTSMALGFFVGFVLVFVPGGIGVRESALYLLLLPLMPHSVSLFVSVASRIWFMAGEGLSVAIVLLAGRKPKL